MFLALPVNHQDGDVVATFFHLVEDIVSIIFEVREKEGRGNGFFSKYMLVETLKSSCHDNSSFLAAFIVLER